MNENYFFLNLTTIKKKHTNTCNDSHRQNYEYFKIKVKINQESWHDVIHYVVTHPRTNNTEKRANKIRLLKKKDNGWSWVRAE